ASLSKAPGLTLNLLTGVVYPATTFCNMGHLIDDLNLELSIGHIGLGLNGCLCLWRNSHRLPYISAILLVLLAAIPFGISAMIPFGIASSRHSLAVNTKCGNADERGDLRRRITR